MADVPDKAKAYVVVAIGGRVVVAIGTTCVGRIVVPRAATQHTISALISLLQNYDIAAYKSNFSMILFRNALFP